jgi:hypothetical protein
VAGVEPCRIGRRAAGAGPEGRRHLRSPQLAEPVLILHRIATARRPETRARRIEKLTALLARGETPHPQRL